MADVESTYVVWRRSDGYVSASNTHRPAGFNLGSDFIELMRTTSWPEARQLIESERDTDEHRALTKSWERPACTKK